MSTVETQETFEVTLALDREDLLELICVVEHEGSDFLSNVVNFLKQEAKDRFGEEEFCLMDETSEN